MSNKKVNTRKTAIREKILKTAKNLFYENGIQAVGVDKIVAEAKVAKMTLYSYFPSKDDLILEYLETSKNHWFEDFHLYLNDKAANDFERLSASFKYLRKLFNDSEYFRGCAFINASMELAEAQHPAHHISLDFQDTLRQCFENWAANSQLNSPRQLSYSLLNLFMGATVAATIEDFPEPLKHAYDTALQLISIHRK